MELGIESLAAGDKCTFFRKQRDYEAAMVNRVDQVLYAIVVTVAASLIALIVAIAVAEGAAIGATGIGTVVSGAAVKFILDVKKGHHGRLDQWVRAISDAGCG